MHLRRVIRLLTFAEAHHRQAIALVAGGLAAIGAWRAPAGLQSIVAWDAYAGTLLLISWLRIFTASPAAVVRTATLHDTGRTLLLFFVLLAACASLGAVGFLLYFKEHQGRHIPGLAMLAIGTIALSWMLVHTMFALHYAYLFYRLPDSRRVNPCPKGLEFPGRGEPDYMDFAYFSFIIGMTSQVSDVQISSRGLRRWALLHGLIAFGFNTAVLAMSINVISGLFSGS